VEFLYHDLVKEIVDHAMFYTDAILIVCIYHPQQNKNKVMQSEEAR